MSKTKKFEVKLNRKQTFFTILTLIFSLLLTFSLGFLTGIRFPYFKSSGQNVSVKSSPSSYSPFESLKASRTEEEKTIHQFTFYDTLPKSSALPLNNTKENVKAKKRKGKSATKKDNKKVKPFEQDLVRERYAIQFGSFKQKEKAYALQNKLKKQGYLVYVKPEKIENRGTWYRVRMGNFNTPEEAQSWVSKLGALSPPAFITSNVD